MREFGELPPEVRDAPLAALRLPARVYHALMNSDIQTVGALFAERPSGLLQVKGLGIKGVYATLRVIAKLDFIADAYGRSDERWREEWHPAPTGPKGARLHGTAKERKAREARKAEMLAAREAGATHQEIAKQFGVSAQRVSQLIGPRYPRKYPEPNYVPPKTGPEGEGYVLDFVIVELNPPEMKDTPIEVPYAWQIRAVSSDSRFVRPIVWLGEWNHDDPRVGQRVQFWLPKNLLPPMRAELEDAEPVAPTPRSR